VSSWMDKLAGKGRRGGSGVLVQISREVVGRRRSITGAVSEVRHPAVLDALSDDDFRVLDTLIDERIESDREFATVLARLTHAAAHAKGFDRQTVDAALRLDAMLPAEDPAREREKLLRDAYRAAQRVGYVQGGRKSLARLGQRAVASGDGERARVLLQQQVDLGPESMDTEDEVESALILGDLLRRDGDVNGAIALFDRAMRSAQTLDYAQGIAEAAFRQIDVRRATLDPSQLATMQRQALEAAKRSGDVAMQSRLIAGYADSLIKLGRLEEAVDRLEDGLGIAREIGDLALENWCLETLSNVERELGRLQEVAAREAELVDVEVRRGNEPAAAREALQHGSTLLTIGRYDAARGAYQRAVELARTVGDEDFEQKAYGGLGVAYSHLNMPVEALNHLMLALDLAREREDVVHEAQWLASIGEALWKFDQPEDAIKAIQQAITAARTADDADLQAGMLSLLGQIHLSSGEPGKARQYYTHALDLYRELDEPENEIQTLSALGAIAMDADQPAESIRLYDEALQLAARHDQRASAVRIYGRLARLAQRQGDDDAALEALEQAASLAETMPNQRALFGQALQHLAVAQDQAGLPVAMTTYEEALDVAREVGDTYGEAMMLVNVGARLIGLGAIDDGTTILEHAIRLTEELGQVGMKLRQRAESLLMSTRTQSRPAGGGRRQPSPRRQSETPRERKPDPDANQAMSGPAPSAIQLGPREMYATQATIHR
jgi:tetratricopeptide (TPR) repeat protein